MGRTIVGIDPGLKGGLCIVGTHRPIIFDVLPMPVIGKEIDIQELKGLLFGSEPECVYVEKQQAHPKQGLTSTGVTMENYGILKGVILGLGVQLEVVMAQTWQKEMLRGMPRGDKTKTSATIIAKRLWPHQSWYKSPRCKNVHDGMIDAALIAEYGRRKRMMGVLE